MRLRALGIAIGGLPTGPMNAITDVAGVKVGMTTLVEGAAGPVEVGVGPVRTGVTVITAADRPWVDPVPAGFHRLNGNGEVTGTHWIRESGLLTTAIGLTNTHAVGVVRDALVHWEARQRPGESFFTLPVVAETFDGLLNDVNGGHVRTEHVLAALEAASSGPVAEGSVGGGTGMVAHRFKGGTGTSSRVVEDGWTVGVLVQANYGQRRRFRVDGVPVGEYLDGDRVPMPGSVIDEGAGSVIVVVATDAPLLPGQCDRLAQRAGLGIGRLGGLGEHTSGDLFLAFATGNRGRVPSEHPSADKARLAPFVLDVLPNHAMNPLFEAVVDATEEAVLNAMLCAETMSGANGHTVWALPPELLLEALERSPRPGQSLD